MSKAPSIQVRFSLIFPFIQVRFTWCLKQIPRKCNRNMPILFDFRQNSGLKVIDEQTHFIPVKGLHRKKMKRQSRLDCLCLFVYCILL